MPHDDPYEDEDWYSEDEDETYDDAESSHCPECSAPLYDFADQCAACGYYLTAADRRSLWSSESKPLWIKVTAVMILLVLLYGLFEISTFFF
jgi:methionyl-tRNA synthetase